MTVDELGPNPDLALTTKVDGVVRQDGRTTDMIFTPAECVAYISEWITLEPGDVIATGTCAGVGHCMDPRVYLEDSQVLESTVENVGTLANRCVAGRVVATRTRAGLTHRRRAEPAGLRPAPPQPRRWSSVLPPSRAIFRK